MYSSPEPAVAEPGICCPSDWIVPTLAGGISPIESLVVLFPVHAIPASCSKPAQLPTQHQRPCYARQPHIPYLFRPPHCPTYLIFAGGSIDGTNSSATYATPIKAMSEPVVAFHQDLSMMMQPMKR